MIVQVMKSSDKKKHPGVSGQMAANCVCFQFKIIQNVLQLPRVRFLSVKHHC